MCKNASQHNKQRQEKMTRDERMKTNKKVVGAMHQVFENTSQCNEPGQERKKISHDWGKDALSALVVL